ncbi:sterol desaturase family protein [Parashewanella spongiae]|uniref:sterol desaturase family protein n=1 Tax=Parashewanella spongiae TaxID=342950 RepID=UPI0014055FAA|nr:sterol desaturase family protein [Parashewanella spongiae]
MNGNIGSRMSNYFSSIINEQITYLTLLTYSVAVAAICIEKLRPALTHPIQLQPLQNRTRRVVTNITMHILNIGILPLFSNAVLLFAAEQKCELLPNYPMTQVLLAILSLDLASYAYHIMVHKFRLLWSFHRVHHIDEFLDVSSAFRFHFMENGLSVIIRYGILVALFGLSPIGITVYLLLESIVLIFQHSNIRLSASAEKIIEFVFITPRLHRIHHHHELPYTDSNFGTIFTIWDRIFGTMNRGLSSKEVTIGLKDIEEQPIHRLFFLNVNRKS